ncbi:hypothetical protein P154DRAFT_39818 [Amniculicola lignicola CBS 123094]|uniref:Uncharacterized protein n=1 Tax=Amniculicola lignicola CBS 123094 TaxID=1392246 RepID=A0A6A5VZK1_9PLEO|nr:hypothetical protein P154DRAFT_39818 [Amniculicola lignicola CBS 123094]
MGCCSSRCSPSRSLPIENSWPGLVIKRESLRDHGAAKSSCPENDPVSSDPRSHAGSWKPIVIPLLVMSARVCRPTRWRYISYLSGTGDIKTQRLQQRARRLSNEHHPQQQCMPGGALTAVTRSCRVVAVIYLAREGFFSFGGRLFRGRFERWIAVDRRASTPCLKTARKIMQSCT